MKKFGIALLGAGLITILWIGVGQTQKKQQKRYEEEKPMPVVEKSEKVEIGDVLVKIVTMSGTDLYSKNLVSLDVLVDNSGIIRMLHVVHVSGTEKDSHTWYNFANVERVTYQYFTITGKGKVRVKQVSGPLVDKEEKDALPSLRYEEYR